MHISFVSFPHPAHVYPTLPLVSVLVRRGHLVTFATSERFADTVREEGCEIIHTKKFDTKGGAEEWLAVASQSVSVLSSYYENSKPDLLIYDFMALAGRVVASRMGVRAIKTNPTFAFERESFEAQVKDKTLRDEITQSSRQADDYLTRHGVVSNNHMFHREGLNIHLFPELLQVGGNDIDKKGLFYAGRCPAEQRWRSGWRKPATSKPIALVAMSTSYIQGADHYALFLTSLRSLGFYVVLSVGDLNTASLEPLPSDVEVVRHVSHLAILPHCSIFVFMSGIVSTAEALYHGVPMIVPSCGKRELEWQADNIERLGLGIHLREADISESSVKDAAVRLGSDSVLRKLREVKLYTRRQPGAEDTANVVEEFMLNGY